MRRRLQNKIAESTWTLPIAVVLAAVCWLLPYQQRWQEPVGLGVALFATYVLMEQNSTFALLRVRSRMVSTVFLLLVTALSWLHPFNWPMVAVLCIGLSFYHLLLTYDRHEPVVPTFHCFLFVSMASLIWPPLAWLSVAQWLSQAFFHRAMSWRCCWAALFGMVLPYFFWGSWDFLAGAIGPGVIMAPPNSLVEQLSGIIAPIAGVVGTVQAGRVPLSDVWLRLNQELVDADRDVLAVFNAHTPWLLAHLHQLAATAFVLLLGLTGFVHYIRKNFDDRISVRMCHYSYLLMEVVVVVWLLLMPTSWPWLFPLLVLLVAPSAAHFFALTRTWASNLWFVLCVLLWLGLVALPHVIPYL